VDTGGDRPSFSHDSGVGSDDPGGEYERFRCGSSCHDRACYHHSGSGILRMRSSNGMQLTLLPAVGDVEVATPSRP